MSDVKLIIANIDFYLVAMYTARGSERSAEGTCAGADKLAAAKYLLSELARGRDSVFARRVFTCFGARSFIGRSITSATGNILFKGIGFISNNLAFLFGVFITHQL